MKDFLKNALVVTTSFLAASFIFGFFVIGPVSMENNKYIWIMGWSLACLIFLISFSKSRIEYLAIIDNREGNDLKIYPLKGLVYGLVGMIPMVIIEILYFIIYRSDAYTIFMVAFHFMFRCLFGPMYIIIRGLNYTWYAYVIATLVMPFISMIMYFIGYHKATGKRIRKKKKDDEDFLNDL